jgi:hypothetical protein
MSLTSTALPEAVLVMAYADASREAWNRVQEWQDLASHRGRPLAAAIAASIAAHLAVRDGDIRQGLAFGEQALAEGDTWVAILATAFLVPALIDAGDTGRAEAMLSERGLSEGELLPVFPFNVAQYARGCLRAASGDHKAAVADLLGVGAVATRWGIVNPAAIPWRYAAALSHRAPGDSDAARRLAGGEVGLARSWGASREIGVALRAAGLAEGGEPGIELLTEAVTVLRGSAARLELARALLDLGAARRRAGARGAARDLLRESLDLAHELGGHAIAGRARDELVAAGGRPRRDAIRGRDALTPSELRVAELAAGGRTNREIAQALFVTSPVSGSWPPLSTSSRSTIRPPFPMSGMLAPARHGRITVRTPPFCHREAVPPGRLNFGPAPAGHRQATRRATPSSADSPGSQQCELAGEPGSVERGTQVGAAFREVLPARVVHGDHGTRAQDAGRFGGSGAATGSEPPAITPATGLSLKPLDRSGRARGQEPRCQEARYAR